MTVALRLLGLLLSVVPPTVATLEFFPLWLGNGKTALSAVSLVLLLLSAIPLFRILKKHLHTPAPWMLWLLLWVLLRALLPIAAAIERIALISFPTSLIGAFCFSLARRREKRHTEVA
ncbi:MAG: hypothetical protein E7609_03760 [Ruminococcaceae bacterium]|nr:hypothetical protein [Oscillospiraceae bacterium]